MTKIGTTVIANDGFATRMGQVADHETNKWGTFHVVRIDGQFEQVGHIGDENALGIGWKVATPDEMARVIRYRNAVQA